MPIPPSGQTSFTDAYGQQYEVVWETISTNYGPALDFTTTVKQPYVWGEQQTGSVENHVASVNGICSVMRTITVEAADGYVILAEGAEQSLCTFPATFPCQPKPKDLAQYHFDAAISDHVHFVVDTGSHWSDPDNDSDVGYQWATIGSGGTESEASGIEPFIWDNVWGN